MPSFFDLNAQTFEVKCGNGHANKVTIGDVRARKTISCRSCGQKVELRPDANFESTVRRIQHELDELKKTIDNFGR